MTQFERFLTLFGQSDLWEHLYGTGNYSLDTYNPEHFHWVVLITNLITISWIIYAIISIYKAECVGDYIDDIDIIGVILLSLFGGVVIGGLLILFMPVTLSLYSIILGIQILLILMNPSKYKRKFSNSFPKRVKKVKKLTKTEQYKQSLLNN